MRLSDSQQQARARTLQLIDFARDQLRLSLPEVEIRFDLRGKSAGMVLFAPGSSPLIRFNTILLEENLSDYLSRTIPHEVAHLVARYQYGPSIRPHGSQWKQVMSLFGAEPRRCHNYDVTRASRRRLKRYRYRCGCQEHLLSSIRHNRIQARRQHYVCRQCKQVLVEKTV